MLHQSSRGVDWESTGGTGKMQDQIRRQRLLSRLNEFWRDRSGNYVIITALTAPILVGMVGLGTEDGLWLFTHQTEQSAADAAAFSAAQNYSMNGDISGGSLSGATGGSNLVKEEDGVGVSSRLRNGPKGVRITVRRP